MKLWMRKFLVVLITILTLGTYIPSTLLEVDAENQKDRIPKSDVSDVDEEITSNSSETELPSKEMAYQELMEKAKAQTYAKFGPRIQEQVEDDFTTIILPKMEQTLLKLMDETEDDYSWLRITEAPAKGYGERIFHVYNERTKRDIARFHVRRDKRPLEGYYFNFHYHVSFDNFQVHHDIGEIFWDKNTPPKWMA